MTDTDIQNELTTVDEPTEKSLETFQTEQTETVKKPPKKWRIWKNLIVICVAWVLLFTAFQGISNLQSSLNVEGDVGMNSMAIIYAFLIFSSAFLPHTMMSIFGMKWTIFICQFGYLAFIAANLKAVPGLMYPASIFLGLAGAPLWTSESSYVTQIGMLNAELRGKKTETGVTLFFGIFFAFFQTSQIWGNLISYLVLNSAENSSNNVDTSLNTSNERTTLTNSSFQCGSMFLQSEYSTDEPKPVPMKLVYMLCYIYIGLAVASIILIGTLLDQRRAKSDGKKTLKETLKNSVHHLVSTFKHLKNRNQILLIPLTLWSGLEQTYINAQFTKGFITCAVGIKYVGLIMIVFGVCDALSSFSFGHIGKYLPRIFCFFIAAAINYSLIITMMIWVPNENQMWTLFVLAGLWGIADGCWQTQIGAAYGVLFTEHESAFSNFRLWESLGFVIAYVYTPRIRIRYAQIILLCVLTISLIAYGFIEIFERRKAKKNKIQEKPEQRTEF